MALSAPWRFKFEPLIAAVVCGKWHCRLTGRLIPCSRPHYVVPLPIHRAPLSLIVLSISIALYPGKLFRLKRRFGLKGFFGSKDDSPQKVVSAQKTFWFKTFSRVVVCYYMPADYISRVILFPLCYKILSDPLFRLCPLVLSSWFKVVCTIGGWGRRHEAFRRIQGRVL